MASCFFCDREPAPKFTLTSLDGNPRESSAWRRPVLPPCGRCHQVLANARREGRVREGTKERWHLGHTVGIFESTGAPRPR